MKRIDRLCRSGSQTNMNATVGFDGCHTGAVIDPEFRVFLAVANGRIRPLAKLGEPQRRQRRSIECFGGLEIAYRERDVDGCPLLALSHAGAPDFTSLN